MNPGKRVPEWVKKKGFSDWKSYMASIRPKPKRTRRDRPLENPGAAYHRRHGHYSRQIADQLRNAESRAYWQGRAGCHEDSERTARRMGMNPKRKWELYDAFPYRDTAERFVRDYEDQGSGKARVRDLGEEAGRLRWGVEVMEYKNSSRKSRSSMRKNMNPIAILNPRPRLRMIYPKVVAVYVRKTSGKNRGKYEHWFESDVAAYGVPDGSVLLRERHGHRLWATQSEVDRGEYE